MDQIGKYEIVGQIGTGGFGVVYEGKDPFLKRRVAIKTCTSSEREIRERFFREAEIAGNLQHRNIVTVHDFGIQDGVPYLVQEYLTGEDLDRKIQRRELLHDHDKVDVLLQVARGLEYAHAQGVIHRDIKPANIRVTAGGLVKIMDFGIAKLANVASHLTRTGMTLGTAAYLPPEQIRGTAVDHRADVFSFGVMAYELVAYRRPFTGKTISNLFFEIIHQEPVAPSSHHPACPPPLESLLQRCLAKDPQDRYPDFGEVIRDLSEILAGLRAEARQTELAATTMLEARPDLAPARPGRDAPSRPPQAARATVPVPPAPAPVDRLLAQAAAQRADGELTAALATLAELRSRYPRHHQAEQLERQCRADRAARRREALDSAVREVEEILAAGELDRAAMALGAARERHPGEGLLDQLAERLAVDRAARERAAALAARRAEIEGELAAGRLEAAELALSGAEAGFGPHELRDLREELAEERRRRVDEQVTATLASARQALERGDVAASVLLLEGVLAVDPDHADAGQLLDAARRSLLASQAEADAEDTASRVQDLLAGRDRPAPMPVAVAAPSRQPVAGAGAATAGAALPRPSQRLEERTTTKVDDETIRRVAQRREALRAAAAAAAGAAARPAAGASAGAWRPAGLAGLRDLARSHPWPLAAAAVALLLLALLLAWLIAGRAEPAADPPAAAAPAAASAEPSTTADAEAAAGGTADEADVPGPADTLPPAAREPAAAVRESAAAPTPRRQQPEPRAVAPPRQQAGDSSPAPPRRAEPQPPATRPAAAEPAPAAPRQPALLWPSDPGVRPAALQSMPPPRFPEGVTVRSGRVLLHVLVDETGGVVSAQPLPAGSQDPRLVAEAQRVATQARYSPASKDGAAGRQWTTLAVEFHKQ